VCTIAIGGVLSADLVGNEVQKKVTSKKVCGLPARLCLRHA
jgi:hypothetical protein